MTETLHPSSADIAIADLDRSRRVGWARAFDAERRAAYLEAENSRLRTANVTSAALFEAVRTLLQAGAETRLDYPEEFLSIVQWAAGASHEVIPVIAPRPGGQPPTEQDVADWLGLVKAEAKMYIRAWAGPDPMDGDDLMDAPGPASP